MTKLPLCEWKIPLCALSSVCLLLQSCGLAIPVTSSAAVGTASLSALNATATQTVWTTLMRHLAVSIPYSDWFSEALEAHWQCKLV